MRQAWDHPRDRPAAAGTIVALNLSKYKPVVSTNASAIRAHPSPDGPSGAIPVVGGGRPPRAYRGVRLSIWAGRANP